MLNASETALLQLRVRRSYPPAKRTIRVAIAFMPSADPALPYGALPLLKAILNQAGYQNVKLRDVNLEIFDDLLRVEPLTRAIGRTQLALKTGKLNIVEADQARNALRSAPDTLRYIEEACEILRDKRRFYDPASLLFAKRIFQLACRLTSAPFANVDFAKYSYSNHSHNSYDEILSALDEEQNGLLTEYFGQITIPSVLADLPDVLGISIPYFSQLIPAFLFARMLKERAPGVHITIGGPVPSWGRHILKSDPRFGNWIDSVAIGEADTSFVALLEYLEGARGPETVPGFILYERAATAAVSVRVTAEPTEKVNLDALPTPDFSAMPLARYFAPDRVLCMTPSRGCYFNICTFCNYAFIKLAPYRVRDAALVAQDATAIIQATGERTFCFEADVMLPRYLGELGQAFKDAEVGAKWHAVARFEKGMTNKIIDKMVAGGCVRLYMGMETVNHRILTLMKKGTTKERIDDILTRFGAAGISVEAGVFGKFPTETWEEANETLEFVREHRRTLTRCDVGEFRLLRGSPIAAEPASFNIQISGSPDQYWYHLPYQPLDADKEDARPNDAMERIQALYPEVACIDVPEDILYTAKLGPNVFHDFFSQGRTTGSGRLDGQSVRLADGVTVTRYFVTNSGGTVFADSVTGAAPERPQYACSDLPVTLATSVANRSVWPLDDLDTAIVAVLKNSVRAEEIVAQLLVKGDTTPQEIYGALERLLDRGIITPAAGSARQRRVSELGAPDFSGTTASGAK